MWICQRCNHQNEDNFCLNCGEPAKTGQTSDLPPTVFGAPLIQPTIQSNQFHNQPTHSNQFQSQPNFALPNSEESPVRETVSDAPRKKISAKVFVLIGLAILLPICAAGFLLYIKVIEPYQSNKEWQRQEELNLARARMVAAKELLPESVSRLSQTFKREQTFDRTQLLQQLSKDMHPAVKAELNNINDVVAAIYGNETNVKLVLQVYKYNSYEQAESTCEKIAQEMIRNKDNFARAPFLVVDPSRRGDCDVSGDLKNSDYIGVHSLYGFLYIDTGHKDYAPELSSQIWGKLIR